MKLESILAASLILCLATACGQTVVSRPDTAEEAPAPAGACVGGVIKDDGTSETGYGFVPSAVKGQVVQEFRATELGGSALSKVCVCWLGKRDDTELDYEVVFYQDADGTPAAEPYAAVAATASQVPRKGESDGFFYEVDVSEVTLDSDPTYIGVRWNPSVDPFFFVCVDTDEETEVVRAFSREDRARRWTDVLNTSDSIFAHHHAVMVRAVAAR